MTNPLLPEFDEGSICGNLLGRTCLRIGLLRKNGDLSGKRIAGLFFALALGTICLSVLSDAAAIKVTLQSDKAPDLSAQTPSSPSTRATPSHKEIRFGYLYELNAAFFYLICAPIFAIYSVKFLRSAHVALVVLARENRLKVRRLGGNDSALSLIRNKRVGLAWAALLMLLLVALPLWICWSEFSPRDGDYYRIAFGYMQAHSVKGYLNENLLDLKNRGKKLELDDIPESELKNWKITNVRTHRELPARKPALEDYLFRTMAIGIQSLFIVFAIWVVLKAVYLFAFIYWAARRNGNYRVQIVLDLQHSDKRFGLGLFDRAFNNAAIIVGIGAVGANAAYLSNLLKGSYTSTGRPIAFAGQSLLSSSAAGDCRRHGVFHVLVSFGS